MLLRLKAQLVGLSAQDFMAEQVEEHEKQYSGRTKAYVPEEMFKDFKKKGISCDYAYTSTPDGIKQPVTFFENQFVTIHADQSSKKTHLARVEGKVLKKLDYRKMEPYGISPLMRPIMDNLEQLIDSNEEERYKDEMELRGKIEELFERGLIQTEALNFIRGRSIEKTYLIIDEAQNATPNQIKGIITRAGKGTKLILLGDPNQIDRPFLDERTNGLSYASEHMKGSPLCWQITMSPEECERSELAMDACKRL